MEVEAQLQASKAILEHLEWELAAQTSLTDNDLQVLAQEKWNDSSVRGLEY